jgi:hypothetical protein
MLHDASSSLIFGKKSTMQPTTKVSQAPRGACAQQSLPSDDGVRYYSVPCHLYMRLQLQQDIGIKLVHARIGFRHSIT